MDLDAMRTLVRADLRDEDSESYRWTDDELDRHIAHAVKDLSEAVPNQAKATLATTAGLRELNIATITDLVIIEAVEYPVDKFPRSYQPFAVWGEVLTMIGDVIPDGSNAYVYYGMLHTLDDSTSTVPAKLEELVAAGAGGYAAVQWAAYGINRVNVGGDRTPQEFLDWGNQKLSFFRGELKRLGRRNRVRIRSLYRPGAYRVSKTTDPGPG